MATTRTIQNSINYCLPILKNQPLLVGNFEPALTTANIILGIVCGPPFRWRWNRNTFSIPISPAMGTDYVQTFVDFGIIETQWLLDGAGNTHQLNGAIALPKDTSVRLPLRLAVEFEDIAGNITFRLDSTPDQDYTLLGDYQKKAPPLESVGQVWGLIPDEYDYIYEQGFLALMMLLVNDSRFPIFESYFKNALLGAQDGLSDQERDIFLGQWTRTTQTLVRGQGAVQSGVAGRTK